MAQKNYYDFTLRLNNINDLFQAPQLDPFAGQAFSISGIDQLINELKPKSLGRNVRTTIYLPGEQLSQDLPSLTQAAVKRYCESRIYQITKEMASLRWQGIKALQTEYQPKFLETNFPISLRIAITVDSWRCG